MKTSNNQQANFIQGKTFKSRRAKLEKNIHGH